MRDDQEGTLRAAIANGRASGWSWGMCGAWLGLNEYEVAHQYGTSGDVDELLRRDGWNLRTGWTRDEIES